MEVKMACYLGALAEDLGGAGDDAVLVPCPRLVARPDLAPPLQPQVLPQVQDRPPDVPFCVQVVDIVRRLSPKGFTDKEKRRSVAVAASFQHATAAPNGDKSVGYSISILYGMRSRPPRTQRT